MKTLTMTHVLTAFMILAGSGIAAPAAADDTLVPDEAPYHSGVMETIARAEKDAAAADVRAGQVFASSTPLRIVVTNKGDAENWHVVTVNRFTDPETSITCYMTEEGSVSCAR